MTIGVHVGTYASFCRYTGRHNVDSHPLFLEITVYLKIKKERDTFELISENKQKYSPNITDFLIII